MSWLVSWGLMSGEESKKVEDAIEEKKKESVEAPVVQAHVEESQSEMKN